MYNLHAARPTLQVCWLLLALSRVLVWLFDLLAGWQHIRIPNEASVDGGDGDDTDVDGGDVDASFPRGELGLEDLVDPLGGSGVGMCAPIATHEDRIVAAIRSLRSCSKRRYVLLVSLPRLLAVVRHPSHTACLVPS